MPRVASSTETICRLGFMAEIEYEVREQDLIAFNEHQLQGSEKLQKTLRRHQGTIPGILVLLAMFLWFYYQDTLSAIYVGITAAVWGALTPLYFKWSTRRQIRKMYSEEEKACILGTYKLRTEPNSLVESSREGESRLKWEDILRVEMTKRYAFIFVTMDTALIVPRSTVKAGDLHEFVKEVDKRIEQAS
jgi:hypothetical protein